jgi:hypothetical protein
MPKEFPVDREHVKGAADKAKGAIKDAANKQAEPKFDKPLVDQI